MADITKTNAMRILERAGIPYAVHTYSPETGIDGVSRCPNAGAGSAIGL